MKQLIKNYTFDTSAKTVTLTDFAAIRLDRLQLIVDVTTNKILYNFADSTVATGTVATNVVTLSTLQGGEVNTDKLQVVYDSLAGDPIYDSIAQDGADATGVTAPAGASGIRGWLSGIYDKITSVIGTAGSAAATKGFLIQGTDGTNARIIKTNSSGQVAVLLNDTFANGIAQQTPGDAQSAAPTTALGVTAWNLQYNGTNAERTRGNWNVNTGDTGAKTATFNGATQTNYNARGALICFNIGTVTGTTPTLTAKLQGSSDGGITWYDIPGAVTPTISASGQTVLAVYPGATVAANAAISFPLPRTWRVVYTIGGTTPSFTITNVQVAYVL